MLFWSTHHSCESCVLGALVRMSCSRDTRWTLQSESKGFVTFSFHDVPHTDIEEAVCVLLVPRSDVTLPGGNSSPPTTGPPQYLNCRNKRGVIQPLKKSDYQRGGRAAIPAPVFRPRVSSRAAYLGYTPCCRRRRRSGQHQTDPFTLALRGLDALGGGRDRL